MALGQKPAAHLSAIAFSEKRQPGHPRPSSAHWCPPPGLPLTLTLPGYPRAQDGPHGPRRKPDKTQHCPHAKQRQCACPRARGGDFESVRRRTLVSRLPSRTGRGLVQKTSDWVDGRPLGKARILPSAHGEEPQKTTDQAQPAPLEKTRHSARPGTQLKANSTPLTPATQRGNVHCTRGRARFFDTSRARCRRTFPTHRPRARGRRV